MRKKELLFVINNLNVGGAEKALLSLLQNFDYSKYKVDLQLFSKEGLLLEQLPSEVCLLPVPKNMIFFDMPFSKVIRLNLAPWRWPIICSRVLFFIRGRKATTSAEAAQIGWRSISKCVNRLDKHYDIAIGYLQSGPNYFVIEKVYATKKIGFIHTDYKSAGLNPIYDRSYFKAFNNVVVVSEQSKTILSKNFGDLSPKFCVIHNVVSPTYIENLAAQEIEYSHKNVVISVGRLIPSKGYDLSLDAFKILKEKGIDFTWIILGDGPLKAFIKEKINEYGLERKVKLLGNIPNPYPHIKNADVFLHTSRYEGKSVVIDEAKILGKAILITNFPTAKEHLKNGKTGIIVEMDAALIANELQKLLLQNDLRSQLASALSMEKNNHKAELIKFYNLIES